MYCTSDYNGRCIMVRMALARWLFFQVVVAAYSPLLKHTQSFPNMSLILFPAAFSASSSTFFSTSFSTSFFAPSLASCASVSAAFSTFDLHVWGGGGGGGVEESTVIHFHSLY